MNLTRADVPANWLERTPDLVRIWRVRLDDAFREVANVAGILSADEVERADRYRFDRERSRFAAGRTVLRLILGGYLEIEARHVAIEYGKHGKPSLAGPDSGIRFNVSHSQDLAVVAVTDGREVGVDVEFLRPVTDQEQLVSGNFSTLEIAAYRSLPRHQRAAAFFAAWTRKEAYLKARGDGLSTALDGFAVSMRPGDPAALLEVEDDEMEPARWGMADLALAPGYAGALVVQGRDWRVDYADWGDARRGQGHV